MTQSQAPGHFPHAIPTNQLPADAAAPHCADAYTLPADPAAALDAILNHRDKCSNYWQAKEVHLVHELLTLAGAEQARQWLGQMGGGVDAADLATADALRLLQAWVRKLGGVVDVADPAQATDDSEG